MQHAGVLPNGVHRYTGTIHFHTSGRFGYAIRVLPAHPLLISRHEMGLAQWA